ncbi:MAG: glutamine--tRNA ligase, partial [Verrucomicrobiota bacterium]
GMPTISGIRRRGYTPAAVRAFCETVGLTKFPSVSELALLEHCVREDLNKHALRVYGVLRPLKVVLTNYPENQVEEVELVNNPENPEAGTRKVPLSRELYIEADDFMENPVADFHRLVPGGEVRLKYAFCIICQEVVKDAEGRIVELRCTYDDATRKGAKPVGRPKVKGTIHWVSAAQAVDVEVRLFDKLFTVSQPEEAAGEAGSFTDYINPQALEVVTAKLEPSVLAAAPGSYYQFERVGYFVTDLKDSQLGKPVFNRTVPLKDSFSKAK